MFDGQIATPPQTRDSTDHQKDQAHRHHAPSRSDGLPAEIAMLDLTPRFCAGCGVAIRRFVNVCEWCRHA